MTTIPELQRIDQRADLAIERHRHDVDTIRADRELTAEAKQLRVNARDEETRARLADLLLERGNVRDTRRRDTLRSLYGFSTFGSPDLARRDADDRASRLDSPQDALSALRRTDLAGDTIYARAIFLTAYEHGWAEVVEQYAAEKPAVVADLEMLAQLEADERADLTNAMHYSLMRQEV